MRRIERVMLIYPPMTFSPQSVKQIHPPLGIAYLAAVLRNQAELKVLDAAVEGYGHEERAGPKLLRYGLAFSEIEERIREFKPDLVGVSCIFSSQFRNVSQVAKSAKKVDPGIVTITGGTHPTFLPELCMKNCRELDLIARGEGEHTLLDLVKASREGGEPGDIDGLVWKSDGELVINRDREPYKDLDSIPFPARDLFPLERYHEISIPMGMVYKRLPFMNMITSRGCPFHCAFCSSTKFWGNRYRKRSVENVLAEMEQLYHEFGIREFKFFDDNLTFDKKRARKLFKGMIERGIDVTWNTPNGVHVVNMDDEMLDLMKKSGCHELTLAVESGDQDVLRDIIRKPTRVDQIEDAARRIKRKGISAVGFFIIGFPGETRRQMKNTMDFSRKLDLDSISLFIFNPLPGTPLFQECVDKGYLTLDQVAEDVDYCEARIDTPEWTSMEVHNLRKNWFWKYNLNLFFRHPIRFFRRYQTFLSRPGLVIEVFKRRIRS
jgi:magnesium-protoporphyrin IX monomethyl ester (oxidative) cyclase